MAAMRAMPRHKGAHGLGFKTQASRARRLKNPPNGVKEKYGTQMGVFQA